MQEDERKKLIDDLVNNKKKVEDILNKMPLSCHTIS